MPGGLSHIEGELVGFENGDILKPRVKLQSHWAEERLTTLVISKRRGEPYGGLSFGFVSTVLGVLVFFTSSA